ncbi:S-layer homology domain-containing protein [Paenibacillus hubeiensis]|uniref:S-layer homology domain-containing protein n=1 Tax=Paenibacillus hubeiensis TaxID=3077330 RepID=UPI0031BB5D54
MKTRKLAAASILSTTLLLGVLASPIAASSSSLTDIPNNYAKNAIIELADAGIMNGTGNGKFNPSGNITRQDFAIVLSKALNLDLSIASSQSTTFSDVPASSYAFAAVEAAYKAGLIQGVGNGKFAGTEPLTREQMAVIFVNALNVDTTGKGSKLEFSDSSFISDWAKEYVAVAIEMKLMEGNKDGSFNPSGSAKRQDVALVTSKFLTKKTELDQEQAEEATTKPEPEQKPEQEPVKDPVKPVQQQPSPPVSSSTPEPASPSVPDRDPSPTPSPAPTPNPEPNPNPESPINAAPVAKDLRFMFEEETEKLVVGQKVTIGFTYDDAEDDQQQSVKYAWYRSANSEGREKVLIPDANSSSYTFTSDDVDHYISVEVTPIAATGTTTGVTSYKVLEQVVMEPSTEEAPLTVDASKFSVIDNYSNEIDRIIGQASAVSRANAWVYIYPWDDKNGNNVVDDGELGDGYFKGTSQSDGSLTGDLGYLEPGDYTFVITAMDPETQYESAKTAENAFKFTLTKGTEPPATLETDFFGFDDNMASLEKDFEANSSEQIIFAYATNEEFLNGTLEITSEGITFGTDDYYYNDSNEDTKIYFEDEQISNDGHTVIISNINGIFTKLTFHLQDKIIPQKGSYLIKFKADADGPESGKTPSPEQKLTLNSVESEFQEY